METKCSVLPRKLKVLKNTSKVLGNLGTKELLDNFCFQDLRINNLGRYRARLTSLIYFLTHRHEKYIILKLNSTKSRHIDHIYGVFPVTLEAGNGHTHHILT